MHPHFFHSQGTNPWRRVLTYIVPVVVFSALFNIPKFLEVVVISRVVTKRR